MVISATATATIPAATSSTSTMLPLRRAGSWAANGSVDGWLSVSAVIGSGAALRRGSPRANGNRPAAGNPALGWRTSPECLNRTGKRKPIRRLFDKLTAFQGVFQRFLSASSGKSVFQAHDVTDDLGDGLIVLIRYLIVDIDGGIARTRQRHVLHDRDIVLLGDFPDLERDVVDTLGDAARRRHAAVVAQRDRVVGRVGVVDAGVGNSGLHELLHALLVF